MNRTSRGILTHFPLPLGSACHSEGGVGFVLDWLSISPARLAIPKDPLILPQSNLIGNLETLWVVDQVLWSLNQTNYLV